MANNSEKRTVSYAMFGNEVFAPYYFDSAIVTRASYKHLPINHFPPMLPILPADNGFLAEKGTITLQLEMAPVFG